jgi:glutaredoxin 3
LALKHDRDHDKINYSKPPRYKEFECKKCPSYFVTEEGLKSHMKRHKNIENESQKRLQASESKSESKSESNDDKLKKDVIGIMNREFNKNEYIPKTQQLIINLGYPEETNQRIYKFFEDNITNVKNNVIKNIDVPTEIFDVEKHIELKYLQKLMLKNIDLNNDLMKQPEALIELRNIILNEIHSILPPEYSYRGINAFVADNTYNYSLILKYIENYRKKLVETFNLNKPSNKGENELNEDVINLLVEMQTQNEEEPENILLGMKRKNEEEPSIKSKRRRYDYGRLKFRRKKSRKSSRKSRRKSRKQYKKLSKRKTLKKSRRKSTRKIPKKSRRKTPRKSRRKSRKHPIVSKRYNKKPLSNIDMFDGSPLSPKYYVYTKLTCPYCHKAKDFLNKKRIGYKEIIITDENKDSILKELNPITNNYKQVPIIIDVSTNKFIGGCDELIKLEK